MTSMQEHDMQHPLSAQFLSLQRRKERRGMQLKKMFGYGFVAALLVAVPAFAQSGAQSNKGGSSSAQTSNAGGSSSSSMSSNASGSVPMADKNFMNKAAQGGLAEVQLGQLAQQNASSSAVKQFGEKMVSDHTQANQQLMSVAQQKGVTPPSDLDTHDKNTKDRLSKLQGAEFDKAYMQNMVKDHEKDVAEFKKEAQNGKDPDVKAFAQKTLPTLEQHLQMARSVASQVGASTGASNKSESNQQSSQK
jgi:putative membrane protein